MPPHPVDVAVALFASVQHGSCSLDQIASVGGNNALKRRRILAGRWLATAPRVITMAGHPRTERGDLWIALLDAGPSAMASHESAAALHRLDGFRIAPASILVGHGRHHRNAVATVHQTRRLPQPVIIDGFPCTPIVRTALDLCATHSPLDIGRVIDQIALRKESDLQRIRKGYEWMAATRRPGSVTLARALDGRLLGYVPARSELERMLDAVIATLPIAPPRREVDLPNRRRVAHRVDRLFEDPPLIVEADGRLWHARLAAMENDKRRDRRALLAGFPTVRYSWHDLTVDAADVRAELLQLLVPAHRAERFRVG